MENPFKLFGIEPIFEIDETQLAATFRGLQRAVHPDRYANASDQERRWAIERAAAVNNAYQILRDPIKRASYLLSLQGITIEDRNTIVDPNFLIEQIELRERLEAALDSSDPIHEIATIKFDINKNFSSLFNELNKLLISKNKELLNRAVEIIQKLHFFERLIEESRILEERYLLASTINM